jgi:hypothetical protein
MGIRTTLYSVEFEAVLAFLTTEHLGFSPEEPLDLDKAAPMLGNLIGADPGKRGLYYEDYVDLGEAAFRGFMPDDLAMFLRRIKGMLNESLYALDWDAGTEEEIYPFTRQDSKADIARYVTTYASALEDYMTRLASEGRGMITVEA